MARQGSFGGGSAGGPLTKDPGWALSLLNILGGDMKPKKKERKKKNCYPSCLSPTPQSILIIFDKTKIAAK